MDLRQFRYFSQVALRENFSIALEMLEKAVISEMRDLARRVGTRER